MQRTRRGPLASQSVWFMAFSHKSATSFLRYCPLAHPLAGPLAGPLAHPLATHAVFYHPLSYVQRCRAACGMLHLFRILPATTMKSAIKREGAPNEHTTAPMGSPLRRDQHRNQVK